MEDFFSSLTARAPLVIAKDQVYLGCSSSQRDYIDFGEGINLGLVPAGSLDDLFKFQRLRNKKLEYQFKKKFIEDTCNTDVQEETERTAEINSRKIIYFIVKELMPFMSGKREVLSDINGADIIFEELKGESEKKPINEEELAKKIADTMQILRGNQEKERTIFANGSEFDYFMGLIKNQDIFSVNGQIYSLSPREENQVRVLLRLNNQIQEKGINLIGNTEKIGTNYGRFLKWRAKSEAIDEFADYIQQKERTKIQEMGDIYDLMKVEEFSLDDIGFIKKEGKFWIYQKIKPFAMLDPRPEKTNVCYEFPELRVGINIGYSNYDRSLSLSEPVLFEAVWHPFVERKDVAFQHICGGKIPNKGRHDNVEWVAIALDDAKNIIMHGLTPYSIRSHGGDEVSGGRYFGASLDDKLNPRAITPQQAAEKKLIITNKWDWAKDNGR